MDLSTNPIHNGNYCYAWQHGQKLHIGRLLPEVNPKPKEQVIEQHVSFVCGYHTPKLSPVQLRNNNAGNLI